MDIKEMSPNEKAVLLKALTKVLKEHRKRTEKGYSIRFTSEQLQSIHNKIWAIASSV